MLKVWPVQGRCEWRWCLEEELSTTVVSATLPTAGSTFFSELPTLTVSTVCWAAGRSCPPSLSLASHLLFLEFSTTKCDVTLSQLPLKGRCVARSPTPNIWCHKSNSAGQSVGGVVFWLLIKLYSLFFFLEPQQVERLQTVFFFSLADSLHVYL